MMMNIRHMSLTRLRGLLPILAFTLTACGGGDPVDPGPGGGDPSADLAATASGPATVADGSLLRSFVSRTAGENLGFDAIAVGDVTGDAVPDYAISGGISQTTPGRLYLVAGVPLD